MRLIVTNNDTEQNMGAIAVFNAKEERLIGVIVTPISIHKKDYTPQLQELLKEEEIELPANGEHEIEMDINKRDFDEFDLKDPEDENGTSLIRFRSEFTHIQTAH